MDRDSKLIFEQYLNTYKQRNTVNEAFFLPLLAGMGAGGGTAAVSTGAGIGIGPIIAAAAAALGLSFLANEYIKLDQIDLLSTAPQIASPLETFEETYGDFLKAYKTGDFDATYASAQQLLLVALDLSSPASPALKNISSVLLNGLNKSAATSDSFYFDAATVAAGEGLIRVLNYANQVIASSPTTEEEQRKFILSNQQLANEIGTSVEMAKSSKKQRQQQKRQQQTPAGGSKGNQPTPSPTPPPSKGDKVKAAAVATGAAIDKGITWGGKQIWNIIKIFGVGIPTLSLLFTALWNKENTEKAKKVVSNVGDAAVSGSEAIRDVGKVAEIGGQGAADLAQGTDRVIREDVPAAMESIGQGVQSAYQSAVQVYESSSQAVSEFGQEAGKKIDSILPDAPLFSPKTNTVAPVGGGSSNPFTSLRTGN